MKELDIRYHDFLIVAWLNSFVFCEIQDAKGILSRVPTELPNFYAMQFVLIDWKAEECYTDRETECKHIDTVLLNTNDAMTYRKIESSSSSVFSEVISKHICGTPKTQRTCHISHLSFLLFTQCEDNVNLQWYINLYRVIVNIE